MLFRSGDVAVEDYIRKGYSSEAIVNFVALLGWNKGEGSEQEVYSLEELIEAFSLERVGRAGSVFNVEKLNWLEKQYIRNRPAEQIIKSIKPLLASELARRTPELSVEQITSDRYLEQVIDLMRERVGFEHEFVTFSSYFFFEPEEYEADALKKRWTADTNGLLGEFCQTLELLEPFTAEAIESALREFAGRRGVKTAALIHPIRILVSGVSFGPSLYHMLEVLGRTAVLRRLSRGLERVVVPL